MPSNVDANAFITNPATFLEESLKAASSKAIKNLLAQLPITPEKDYSFDADAPQTGWQEGKLHWYPVGRDRGNAGRIKLAGNPENPIAERAINSMEAIIELARQRELLANPSAAAPASPREAVLRYFDLPPLDQIPAMTKLIKGQKPDAYVSEMANKIRVRLLREKSPVEWTVLIEDEGVGQGPGKMHKRLLSLGQSDKGDKSYLIGVFGQGGSSAYATCEYSWMISRRPPDLLGDDAAGVGWTIIKQIIPGGRRDPYWAYLAAHHDGRVPAFAHSIADALKITHGTRIAHIGWKVGKAEPARTLYQALNHLLFNPVLPYRLHTRPKDPDRSDRMAGNAYRLSNLEEEKALDKTFAPQAIDKKVEE